MSTRRAKQLIYGALYLIVILFLFAAFYFIFIHPFTGSSAVAECTLSTCVPTSTAAITTSSVSIFTTSPGHYTFLAQAVDTDTNFGAQILRYQIDLYDTVGALIQSIPAQSFIYPSQYKYLVVPNVIISSPIDHATLEITEADWIASSTLGAIPQFILQNTQAVTTSNSIAVSGQFTNKNIGSFEQVMILAIFNDGNGHVIGASQTEIDNVQPQSTNDFSVLYPVEPNVDPANNQIIIYAIR